MQRLFRLLALPFALVVGADQATALGLGRVDTAARLGQPLDLTIALRLEPGEAIESRCVQADVRFGERTLGQDTVRTRVETSRSTGQRRLRVMTTIPVDEPVVGVQLQLQCPSRLAREFTVFADPPGATVAAPAPESGSWQADRADSPVSPIVSAATPAPRAPAPAATGRRTPLARASRPRTISPEDAAAPRAGPRGGTAQAPAAGHVLRLDPVDADALILPSLQMDTRLSVPGLAASGVALAEIDPELAQRRAEQERLKAMEAALLKLRADSEATQQSLAAMQQRVRAAEAERYANPLVYVLAALCVLLAAGSAVLWRLRQRDRAQAAWWAVQPPAAAPAAPAPGARDPDSTTTGVVSLPPPPLPEPAVASAPPEPAPARPPEPDGAAMEQRRPMSAEELIDLEQQAEFFVVLGQDEAAIDLLMGHVRSTGGVSPLPYLKLLEIYRRRGERGPYDRIRERFNRRFNAYAPEWDVDPEDGLSLEGYPEVVQRLQDAWRSPSQAMELLDAALFRQDAGPTFDVPAYRELLFLYSTARDLAERDVGAEGVDLLLPLGDETGSPLMTSLPPSTPPAVPTFSLDLDVSTEQPPGLTLEEREPGTGRR